mgnify:CR=1 FL=1
MQDRPNLEHPATKLSEDQVKLIERKTASINARSSAIANFFFGAVVLVVAVGVVGALGLGLYSCTRDGQRAIRHQVTEAYSLSKTVHAKITVREDRTGCEDYYVDFGNNNIQKCDTLDELLTILRAADAAIAKKIN